MTQMGQEPRRDLYRSRTGVIFGVCKGMANHLDTSVFWMRIIAVLLLVFSGLAPIIFLYIVMALLMKPEPVLPL